MNHFRAICILGALGAIVDASAQRFIGTEDHACAAGSESVRVSQLYSDSTCSSFLICIDTEVKPHLHRLHTEHVFVLDGEGTMQLGDEQRHVSAGDAVIIPPNTRHSVKVTDGKTLRVVSVQSPRFDGSDRVFLDP